MGHLSNIATLNKETKRYLWTRLGKNDFNICCHKNKKNKLSRMMKNWQKKRLVVQIKKIKYVDNCNLFAVVWFYVWSK